MDYRKITVCTGSDDYLASREPATVYSPSRVFVYLCSRLKILFSSNRLNKNQEHFDGIKQALQGKKENHVTPLSSKSRCEHFNKTIYSSHLVPIWRNLTKIKKKTPQISGNDIPNAPPTPTPKKEESKENEKVNLKYNYEIRSSLAKLW